jgi:hypothetical protein
MTSWAAAATSAGARSLGVTMALLLAVAACAPSYIPRSTYPPVGSTPVAPGDATSATIRTVIGALGAAGLQAAETSRSFRPPEGPLLAAAPRSIVQVTMPDDPDHGFIAIYALDSPNTALAAAKDHAAWVASSIGRINFAPGMRFVLRVLGSNVIWFSWLPGSSPDSRLDQIGPVLETIGEGVAVPS